MTGDNIRSRVEKVEEHCAFAERTVEQLSEEVKLLNERVRQAMKKIEALERRLESVMESPNGGVSDRGVVDGK